MMDKDRKNVYLSQTARKQLIWSDFQMLINWNDQAFKKINWNDQVDLPSSSISNGRVGEVINMFWSPNKILAAQN